MKQWTELRHLIGFSSSKVKWHLLMVLDIRWCPSTSKHCPWKCILPSTSWWCLWENVQHKQPKKWCTGDWFLHHDSALRHCALSVQEFVAKNSMTSAPFLLLRCGTLWHFLFPEFKLAPKGRKFKSNHRLHLPNSKHRTCAIVLNNDMNSGDCIKSQGNNFKVTPWSSS
jgi:hypothetical protein